MSEEKFTLHPAWEAYWKLEVDLTTMTEQRDNLVGVLELLLDGLLTYAPDYMHGLPKQHYVDEAMEALAAVKGGSDGRRQG